MQYNVEKYTGINKILGVNQNKTWKNNKKQTQVNSKMQIGSLRAWDEWAITYVTTNCEYIVKDENVKVKWKWNLM